MRSLRKHYRISLFLSYRHILLYGLILLIGSARFLKRSVKLHKQRYFTKTLSFIKNS